MSENAERTDDHNGLVEALSMVSGKSVGFCDNCGFRILDQEQCSILWVNWTASSRGISLHVRDFGGLACNGPDCGPGLLRKFQCIDEGELRRLLSIGEKVFEFAPELSLTTYRGEYPPFPKNIWLRIEALEKARSQSLKKMSGNWRWKRGR